MAEALRRRAWAGIVVAAAVFALVVVVVSRACPSAVGRDLRRNWLFVRAPSGGGWQLAEETKDLPDSRLRLVQARLAGEAGALLLSARDYAGAAPAAQTLEALRASDWRATFAPLFQRVERVELADAAQHLASGEASALEVTASGLDREGRPLRLRERYAPARGHLLVVSASGPPAVLDAHAQEVNRWFGSATFDPAAPDAG